ncbi:ABC transporter ATP-binding protein [Salicibibacter cibi]|uniref:ABC transporter ATP-binding protein n=1 Tax=Salicibibacter cibi TaxID=2743001 RepID=A0A7T6ZAS3_9BACI|nr:ABC transporter ATP-binding protein [Salicibibacter cibi]QQK80071.1 ABC transporter ATP-binding protein [Salicibibacter cibi]
MFNEGGFTLRTLIKAENLTKTYRGRTVVKNGSLHIREGETIALMGPNGAGKTTMIGMLLRLIHPDSGVVQHWTQNFKAETGVQLQSTPFFEGHSVEENIRLFAAFYNVKSKELDINSLLEVYGLREEKKSPAIKLSLGQQKRLAIAVTTLHNPKLIILDEPSAGLDPRGQKDIQQHIVEMKERGDTVFFSSHDMLEVSKVADRVMIMNDGEIAVTGTPQSLINEHGVSDVDELYSLITEQG